MVACLAVPSCAGGAAGLGSGTEVRVVAGWVGAAGVGAAAPVDGPAPADAPETDSFLERPFRTVLALLKNF